MEALPAAFDEKLALLEAYLSELGEAPASAPYAAYYNHDMQKLDVELGFPVAKPLPGRGTIAAGMLPAFDRAVSGIHKGSYSSLHESYAPLYQYIAENRLAPAGAHYDFYISNPDHTPEGELLTKVVIPVREEGEQEMDNMIFCQSCGMPMQKEEDFGTEQGGGKNGEYCGYCYRDGAFTADLTMDEMIAFCAEHVEEWDMKMTKEDAIAMMRAHFPTLKRWQAAQ